MTFFSRLLNLISFTYTHGSVLVNLDEDHTGSFTILSGVYILQACFCNIFICCRDIHLPICWNGCLGYWEVENCKQKVHTYMWRKWYLESLTIIFHVILFLSIKPLDLCIFCIRIIVLGLPHIYTFKLREFFFFFLSDLGHQ